MSGTRDARSGESGRSTASLSIGEQPIPTTIDRYVILRKLATGGMAELFLAKQSGLEGFEKVVVIKRILSHLAQDEEFVSMFLDEARIAAKLSHPNIVQIYDLGKADDTYYIAMEYVSGRNVQHMMTKQAERGGHIPIEHACRVIAGVCEGLHYAHSRNDYDGRPLNIVHRDISPQNILVSFAGGTKVVDFGIAKASTQLAQTRAGVLKGKYAYMSPEQVRGQRVDHRSDLFALGLVFYEMLTGRRAFERDSSLKTLKAIVQEKPLNPRELNPDVPPEVVKLLSRALEKSPDRRYKNAQDFQLAIEDYLESSPRKSNTVRLSLYLHELFDDELNSEHGTMVVEGVGQVIIPTSVAKLEKASAQEEVDSNTLSAALLPEPPSGREPLSGPSAPSGRSPRQPSEPQVHDVQLADTSSPASSRAPLVDPSLEAIGLAEEDLSDDDSGHDRTIPTYSLEDYERQRAQRQQVAEVPAGSTPRQDPFEQQQTVGSLPQEAASLPTCPSPGALTTESTSPGTISSGPMFSQDRSASHAATVDDVRAAQLLAKVDAMAGVAGLSAPEPSAGLGLALASAPGLSSQASGTSRTWESGTSENRSDAETADSLLEPTGPEDLPDEAVVGPQGPVRPAADVAPAIRPPAMAAPLRPPPSPGRLMAVREVVRDIAPSAPVAAAVAGPLDLNEATPNTVEQPAAGPESRPSMVLFAALGVMGLFLGLSIGALVLLFIFADATPPAAPTVQMRLLKLDTEPPGAEVTYGALKHLAPASFVVPSGANVKVRVTHEGKEEEFELQVPVGTTALEMKLELKR